MRLRAVPESFAGLGVGGAALYWTQRVRAKLVRDERTFTLKAPDVPYPLVFRANTTDPIVFDQVFIAREFASLKDLRRVGLVVDCGAYTGYSAAYFLSRFPTCHVIAVEPDLHNFRLLERNVARYGSRVQLVRSAVWSQAIGVKVVSTFSRGEWGRQVREIGPKESPDVMAVDIETLLRESTFERISLLKVDIEGAETVVFADAPWIDFVDNIVIELHDNTMFGDATSVFEKAIAGKGFAVQRFQERTICRRE